MSNEETNIDRMVRLSLHILRQLDKYSDNDRVWIDPWNDRVPKTELELSEEDIARWDEWKFPMTSVLRDAGYLQRWDRRHYFYRNVISEKGQELCQELQKSEDEKKTELEQLWRRYEEKVSKYAPIQNKTIDEYANAIHQWFNKRRRDRDLMVFNNIKRILAEYYFSDQPLSNDVLMNMTGARNVISALGGFGGSMVKFLLGFQHERMHYFAPSSFLKDIPNQGYQLLDNFKEALRETIGEDELKKWQLIPIISPSNLTTSGQEENEEEEDTEDVLSAKLTEVIDEILDHKKQIILYGVPGTGKTFTANKYIESKYTDETKREKYVRYCTFHPEYGYEHFIEGFHSDTNNNEQMVFRLESGTFKSLCDEARKDTNNKYYLIIDEINRGDIPRIFGELISLIEKDKREELKAILPYSKKPFTVPANVYIIATMNTADRSIALLDVALRRRFGFLEIQPDSSLFGDITVGVPKKGGPIPLRTWFDKLNRKLKEALQKNRHDAEHILIGHSYFLGKEELTRARFKLIIQHEIYPLIQEYCYEDKEAYDTLVKHIKDTTGISPIGQSDDDRGEGTETQKEPSDD